MKRSAAAAIAVLVLVLLATGTQSAAQHIRYKLIDLGTLGGPSSITCISCFDGQFFASSIVNENGTAVGFADTSNPDPFPSFCFFDCLVDHAFRWQNGAPAL